MKMKILSGIILIFTLAVIGAAQAQNVKGLVEIINSSERVVKGAPFSAEAINESTQTLSDGNKITHKSTNKMYRDSEGRFRRDEIPQPGGSIGSVVKFPPTIFILDPIAGFRYYLNPVNKTIRQASLNGKFSYGPTIIIKEKEAEAKFEKETEAIKNKQSQIQKEKETVTEKRKEIEIKAAERAKKNIERAAKNTKRAEEHAKQTEEKARAAASKQTAKDNNVFEKSFVYGGATKTELLGIRNIEGVEAEGTRSTTTIEAGAIGNERPINIIYEKWYSKDLQLIVLSTHNDPRFGEQTYRLTNIKRSEPERFVFELPADYKLINGKPEPKSVKTPSPPANQRDLKPPAPPRPKVESRPEN